MTDDRPITMADIDRQIEVLKAKERDLKRQSTRVSDEIKALRPQLYLLVKWKRDLMANGEGPTDA